MQWIVGIALPTKTLDEVAGLREGLEPMASGRWFSRENLCVRLAGLGEVAQDWHERVVAAADRSAATQQGFQIEFRGLAFDESKEGVEAYLHCAENAGMLQSLTFSFLERLPEAVEPRIDLPWRPKLTVASFPSLGAEVRLRLEAALLDRSWSVKVRDCTLFEITIDGSLEVVHTAKLPGAAA